jgi:hypothetical protein
MIPIENILYKFTHLKIVNRIVGSSSMTTLSAVCDTWADHGPMVMGVLTS